MQHLDSETLARLVDEPPAEAEAGHLRNCLACRLELREMRAQTEALAGLVPAGPPPAAWDALEARLHDEGLIRAPARRRWSVSGLVPLPAAAAVAALALGATLWSGWRTGGAPADGGSVAVLPSQQAEPAAKVPTRGEPSGAVLASAPEAGPEERERIAAVPPPAAPGSRFASDVSGGGAEPAGAALAANGPEPSAAARELVRAEAAFLAMLDRYARIGSPGSGADPVTRLAALDLLAEATTAALERTPGDPVINGYHLIAVREREALLRELAESPDAEWF